MQQLAITNASEEKAKLEIRVIAIAINIVNGYFRNIKILKFMRIWRKLYRYSKKFTITKGESILRRYRFGTTLNHEESNVSLLYFTYEVPKL